MKLVVLLSIAALVVCDYAAPSPDTSNAFNPPEKVEAIGESIAPIEPGKPFFKFGNFYRGAFPPAPIPPGNFHSFPAPSFHSFTYPFKAFNLAASPQGILPPISQIIPPQISQIIPPQIPQIIPPQIPQIVPPIFGNARPVLPPPSSIIPQSLSKFSFPYSSFYQFPRPFPSTFSFPPYPSTFTPTQIQGQPPKTQPESLANCYGPPASGPTEPEPEGPAETSAPFEPSSVSFPYEPAAPEAPEPAAPLKPAQEYGLPPQN